MVQGDVAYHAVVAFNATSSDFRLPATIVSAFNMTSRALLWSTQILLASAGLWPLHVNWLDTSVAQLQLSVSGNSALLHLLRGSPQVDFSSCRVNLAVLSLPASLSAAATVAMQYVLLLPVQTTSGNGQ